MITVSVKSGMEALDHLAAGEEFDLAILDRNMPGMDGLELAESIRQDEKGARLPLIMLSSVDQNSPRIKELRFAALHAKPVKQRLLHRTLVSVLSKETPDLSPAVRTSPFDASLAAAMPLRILVAEDNAVNQKVATHILARLGYRVDVVANGIEALEALRNVPYDIILMDVQMPEMDGLTATREIRRRFAPQRQPVIIALTANALSGDREKCLEAGMDDYLSKPARQDELRQRLEHWQHRRSPAAEVA
jgi:CheY-like chemotaxis protein